MALTSDIWTADNLIDFLAISINTSDKFFKRNFKVIEMPGKHTAENIKAAIEEIINSFEFDNSKIDGRVSDEGSAYVRLFEQIQNCTVALAYFSSLPEIDFEPDIVDDTDSNSTDNDDGLLCLNKQIDNLLVNYDYFDNDDIDSCDNCDVNSEISNVNRKIDEAWNDMILVSIESTNKV